MKTVWTWRDNSPLIKLISSNVWNIQRHLTSNIQLHDEKPCSLTLELGSAVSRTHCPTYRRQSSLSTQPSCASYQDMPISFENCPMVSTEFFGGLPGLRFEVFASQDATCFGCLLSFVNVVTKTHAITDYCRSHALILAMYMRSRKLSCKSEQCEPCDVLN